MPDGEAGELDWLLGPAEEVRARWATMGEVEQAEALIALACLPDKKRADRLREHLPRLPMTSLEDAIEWEIEVYCDRHTSRGGNRREVLIQRFVDVGLAHDSTRHLWHYRLASGRFKMLSDEGELLMDQMGDRVPQFVGARRRMWNPARGDRLGYEFYCERCDFDETITYVPLAVHDIYDGRFLDALRDRECTRISLEELGAMLSLGS